MPQSSNRVSTSDLGTSPTVLLLIDFINPLDFEGAEQLRRPAEAAARNVARLRRSLGKQGAACIFANDNYGNWRSDFMQQWERCQRMAGEPGRIARSLRPRSTDFTVLKPLHSAFYQTPLESLLDQLRCKRLVITGLAADSCVLFTAMDAYLRGYRLWIPADCVASETDEARLQALAQMKRVLKARAHPSSDELRKVR
jgi:nicotinamidase-related amidase